MSERDVSPTQWDAPNQQVVRPDESAPWEEGDGGSTTGDPDPKGSDEVPDLDSLTKDELLVYARNIGVSPANRDMTKDELRAGIDDRLAGG